MVVEMPVPVTTNLHNGQRLCTAAMAVATVLSWGLGARAAEPAAVDFVRDVQPIFVEHCYQCHGPDEQESGLRFDLRDKALAGGDSGPLWVAGKSDESELVRRITAEDESERMPPLDAQAKPLSAEQIATLQAWIDAGAKWPEPNAAGSNHWAFQPIKCPEAPAVKNEAWIRNPIDRFVLASSKARASHPPKKPTATR